MSAIFSLSPETLQLARGAGTWRQQFIELQDPPGYKVIFEGGEFSYLIYEVEQPGQPNGLEYRYGTQDRNYPPIDDYVVSTDKDSVERWFITQIGDMYRSYNRLRLIRFPYRPEFVKSGYEVIIRDKSDFMLKRADGSIVDAVVEDSPSVGPLNVIKYSHVADLPVRDLARSYLDPEGYPLLHDYLYYPDQSGQR